MKSKAKKIKEIIKGSPKESFGTNPSDPWSVKYGIAEDASLAKYLNARGINPKFISKDTKISHAKSAEFLKWKRDHQFEDVQVTETASTTHSPTELRQHALKKSQHVNKVPPRSDVATDGLHKEEVEKDYAYHRAKERHHEREGDKAMARADSYGAYAHPQGISARKVAEKHYAAADQHRAAWKDLGSNEGIAETLEGSSVNPQFINVQATKILAGEAQRITNAPLEQLFAPLMKQYNLTLQQIDSMIPGGLKKAAGEYGIMMKEGGFDINRPDPVWITINGKRWKWFFNYVVGRKAMDTLNAKFRKEGSKNKADWEPADLEDNPEHGIKVGESALDKFRQGSAGRQAKHDKIEAERKANAAAGKEPDVKSAVDRLDAQINAKEEIDHEGDTVKNSLHTIIRVATHLEKNISDEEQFPEWVSEKVGAIHSMMVTVMNYVISDHEQKDGDRLDQGPKKEDHSTATGGWGQGSMNAAYKSSALAGAGHDDRTMESDDYFNKLKETLEAAVDERSKSQAQWNLMHAVAHNPAFAKKVGVKQSVGQEFSAADAGHDPKSLPKRVVSKKKK